MTEGRKSLHLRHAIAGGEVLEDGSESFCSHFGGVLRICSCDGNVEIKEGLCRNISSGWEAMFVDLGGGLGDGPRRCGLAYAEACSVLSARIQHLG